MDKSSMLMPSLQMQEPYSAFYKNGFLGLQSEIDISPMLSPSSSTEYKFQNSSNNGEKKVIEKKGRAPKFAFEARSHVDILDDGFRWRKYGQKALKNNKHPRSYYRCTYQGCNVRKQVQRLSKDEGVVVTIYVGMHNHHMEKSPEDFHNILDSWKTKLLSVT